jgi:hypothetical protein
MQNLKLGEEKGQILAYVLLFMVLGTLLITPLLSLMSSGMKSTNVVFNTKADELYAADSGIVEGQWRIKSGNLGDLANPKYTPYNYGTTWTYRMAQTYPMADNQTQINGQDVWVSIKNEWIPNITGVASAIPYPNTDNATNIINYSKLVVTGSSEPANIAGNNILKYHIKLSYFVGAGENLVVNTVGAWLPTGYTYYSDNTNKSSPEGYASNIRPSSYPSLSNPNNPYPWKGNQAVQWTWSTPLPFASIPDKLTSGSIIQAEVTFFVRAPADAPDEKPGVVSWITTGGADIDGNGIATGTHYTWNADVKVFKVSATAGNTTIDSYMPQTETRKMQAAISGDYYATGNSLLYDDTANTGHPDGYHDTPVDPSYADVTSDNIPGDANVEAAFLYWTGWKDSSATSNILTDDTSNFNPNWDPGVNSAWSLDGSAPNSFKGNNPSGKSTDLTLNNGRVDLSGTSPGTAVISWDYWYTPNSVFVSPLNPDQCSNYAYWTRNPSSAWGQDTNHTYFRGHGSSSLTLSSALNLASYNSVNVSWKMWREHSASSSDIIYLDVSNSSNFSSYITIATITGDSIVANKPNSNNYLYALPATYLTNNCKIRFRIQGFSSNNVYCDLDDITVATGPGTGDGVDFTLSSDGTRFDSSSLVPAYNGTTMTYGAASKQTYSYQIPDSYLTAGFRIKISLVGFANYNSHISNINIVGMQADKTCVFKIGTTQVSLTQDGLPQEGGELTSSRSQIIPNYIGNQATYSYASYRDVTALVRAYSQPYPIIDSQANRPGYARYTVSGVDASYGPHTNEYQIAYAGWSIVIIYSGPTTLGHQLYLYDKFINSSDPTINNHGLIDFNGTGGRISGFVVPPQIKQAVLKINVTSGGFGYTSPPAVSITGGGGTGALAMAKLTGDRVTSVAVWNGGSGYIGNNLPVVFTSVDGKGSGAAATATVGDELNSAKMTCFVGEGDDIYQNDYVSMNGTKLWDGTTDTYNSGSNTSNAKDHPNDVWNGKSNGSQFSNGIDIDTLGIDPTLNPPQYITWTSGILKAGDTSAQVNMYTETDIWNLIYVILSFRSTITTGGDLSYLIH